MWKDQKFRWDLRAISRSILMALINIDKEIDVMKNLNTSYCASSLHRDCLADRKKPPKIMGCWQKWLEGGPNGRKKERMPYHVMYIQISGTKSTSDTLTRSKPSLVVYVAKHFIWVPCSIGETRNISFLDSGNYSIVFCTLPVSSNQNPFIRKGTANMSWVEMRIKGQNLEWSPTIGEK